MIKKTICALAVATSVLSANAAHATTFDPSVNKFTPVSFGLGTDYYFYPDLGLVATDMQGSMLPGLSGRMDYYIDSDDPNATVYIPQPNEVFGFGTYNDWGVLTPNLSGSPADVTWKEVVAPHHTYVEFSTSPAFDSCSDPSVADYSGFCSSDPTYWFNDAFLMVTSTASAHVFLGPAPVATVPEPATWGMMLAGFFTLGATLRRRRSQGLTAA